MRWLAVLACIATLPAVPVTAQQPVPPPDSVVPPESAARPAEPTPEQLHFLDGLRTASRGVAQIKDGLGRVTRAQAKGDSAGTRHAGRFLAGLCGSARGFLARGRPRMLPTAYEDSTRVVARRLTTQIDSLIAYMGTCELTAGKTPVPVATDLGKRIKTYDTALNSFRLAIGLPVKADSSQGSRRQ